MAELSPEKKAALALLDQGEEYALLFFRKAKGLDIFHALKERGCFLPDRNPGPVETEKGLYQIPQWPVLDYLKRAADEAAASMNLQYAEEIMQVLRDVTKPQDGKKRDNYRTWWRFAEILSVLPADVIKEHDIQLVSDWLGTAFDNSLVTIELGKRFLPRLLAGGTPHELALAYNVIDVITRIRWTEKPGLDGEARRNAVSVTDAHWLKDLFKKNSRQIGEKCNVSALELLTNRIKEVIQENDRDRFSYIWRPAIEDHEQNKTEKLEFENILLTALREAALGLLDHQAEKGREFVVHLIDSGPQLFKRLAFYLISEKFFPLQDILYKKITKEWFNSWVQHELFGMLNRHFPNFMETEKTRVVQLINSLVAEWAQPDERDAATNVLRLTWLSAIQGKGDATADELYAQYLAKVGQAPTRPEFPYYTEFGWVQHKSPYTVDELLSMSAQDLVRDLNQFRSPGWKGPDEEGLAASLKEAVIKNNAHFSGGLEYFISLKPRYLTAVLDAYKELRKDQQVDWAKTISFCLLLIEKAQLWVRDDELGADGGAPRKSWVIRSIVDLISAGLQEEANQIPLDLMDEVERILVSIIENEPSEATGNSKDALTEAINTAKGRAIECFFLYSIRCAQSEHKKKNEHHTFWNHIRPVYDSELTKSKDGNYEFSVLAGRWLPSLRYLSPEWVDQNIDRIFSTVSDSHWLYAMQGYGYVNSVYKDVYLLLKNHGHLRRVVDSIFEYDRTRETYLQHITVAYLHGDESLEDGSLFRYVLDKWSAEDIHDIVWFLWTQRNDIEPRIRERILVVWRWFSNRIRGQEEANKSILSDLSQLIVFLEEIEEQEKKLLMQCAPYIAVKHNSYFFVEHLDKLASKNPQVIADIYLNLIEKFLPDYPEEAIQSLVTKFFQAGLIQEANIICDRYLAAMYDFLKKIHQRFNP